MKHSTKRTAPVIARVHTAPALKCQSTYRHVHHTLSTYPQLRPDCMLQRISIFIQLVSAKFSPCRRRPRPAVDYLDSYFVTPAEQDDYYYDDEYEDIYAAVQYQKALARKRAKAAQSSMGKEAVEKAQVCSFKKCTFLCGCSLQSALVMKQTLTLMQYFKTDLMSARPIVTTPKPKVETPNPTQPQLNERQKIRALRLRSEFSQVHRQARPNGVFASLYS